MNNPDRELLERYKSNLQKLRQQAAEYGMEVPLHIQNHIDFHVRAIEEIEKIININEANSTDTFENTIENSPIDTIDLPPFRIDYLSFFPIYSNVFMSIVLVLLLIILASLFFPDLRPIVSFISSVVVFGFVFLKILAIADARNRQLLLWSIKHHWKKWEERINVELRVKGYVQTDDIQNLGERLGVKKGYLGGILDKYDSLYPEKVVYSYIYDKKTGLPLTYFFESETTSYATPRKVIASRTAFPPSKYEYSSDARRVQMR